MAVKIVSDAHIPFVREMFSDCGELDLIPGHRIDADAVRDADALLVRSVTRIDAALLRGSSIQFVGSATAGTDHVDLAFLKRSGVVFASAPGGNADSVVEYVLAALVSVSVRRRLPILDATIGIVGCGQVGGRLARRAEGLGLNVLRNDPPLERDAEARNESHPFIGLEELVHRSDIVSLHVPLYHNGPDKTVGLIGRTELDALVAKICLLNASRGGVVDEAEYLRRATGERPRALVLDVWEGEPLPDLRLQRLADVATPHIAGYSRDAKYRSTRMVAEALFSHFGLKGGMPIAADAMNSMTLDVPSADPAGDRVAYLHEVIGQMYPIMDDHARMAAISDAPDEARASAFRRLRADYPPRYGFDRYVLDDSRLTQADRARLTAGLGIRIAATGQDRARPTAFIG